MAAHDIEINIQAESSRVLIKSIVSIIGAFIDNMKMVQDEVKHLIESDRYASAQIDLLSSIPGISWFGAAILLSEIGDITRFKKPALLVAYCAALTRPNGNLACSKAVKIRFLNVDAVIFAGYSTCPL